jgi:hypothetical protein
MPTEPVNPIFRRAEKVCSFLVVTGLAGGNVQRF